MVAPRSVRTAAVPSTSLAARRQEPAGDCRPAHATRLDGVEQWSAHRVPQFDQLGLDRRSGIIRCCHGAGFPQLANGIAREAAPADAASCLDHLLVEAMPAGTGDDKASVGHDNRLVDGCNPRANPPQTHVGAGRPDLGS